MEITVVVDDGDRPRLEPRLAEIAGVASELAPSVRPQISILSPEQWERQQASESRGTYHNIWLAPDTTQRKSVLRIRRRLHGMVIKPPSQPDTHGIPAPFQIDQSSAKQTP